MQQAEGSSCAHAADAAAIAAANQSPDQILARMAGQLNPCGGFGLQWIAPPSCFMSYPGSADTMRMADDRAAPGVRDAGCDLQRVRLLLPETPAPRLSGSAGP